jgi:hypothetical protein
MAKPRAALVLTTIFAADALEEYCENFARFGHLDDVEVIIIPDRKTPAATYERARGISGKGLKVSCPTLDEQDQYLKKVGLTPDFVPSNSDNRRNIGFLMAYESDAHFLISIDDDNFCTREQDAFTEHAVVCSAPAEYPAVSSPSGFYNICDLLEMEHPNPVYPRGFPYFARHRSDSVQERTTVAEIHVNAGLWTLDPDVDALTWLVCRPRVRSFKGRSVVLAADTWSPVNTQNTALRRDAIPAYYFLRMGYPISGIPIDRYGDIFSGYFVQACMKHLGGAIRFGSPDAEHRRNSHNHMRDAINEIACIAVLEDLLPWLREAKLSGNSYMEAYTSLSHQMEEAAERFRGGIWTDATRSYFHQAAFCMRLWLQACSHLAGGRRLATAL